MRKIEKITRGKPRTGLELDRKWVFGRISGVMQSAVITGYILASIFALCGLLNTTLFCLYGDAKSITVFLSGIVLYAWPLAVGAVILLLIHILNLLEQLRGTTLSRELLNRRNPRKNNTVAQKTAHPMHREPEHYFPVRERSPQPVQSQQEPENTAPVRQEDDVPETEENLQFFKLH